MDASDQHVESRTGTLDVPEGHVLVRSPRDTYHVVSDRAYHAIYQRRGYEQVLVDEMNEDGDDDGDE